MLTGQAELAAAADGPVTPTHNSGPRLAAGPGKSTSPGQGPAPSTEPAAEPSATSYGQARETAARRQVEDSERVRAMQVDDQRVATEEAAQALVEERRLTVEQAEAFERLKRAETAVHEMTRHMLDLDHRRADAEGRIQRRIAALRPLLPVIVRMSTYPVETLLGARVPTDDAVRGILVLRTVAQQAEVDARWLIKDREALDAATKAAADVAPQLAAAEAARSYETDSLARQLAETKERREAAQQDAADAARRAAAEAARANTLRSMLQILETQRRLEEARAREDMLRAERDQRDIAAEAARLRQVALSRPTGAGTLAADAKPAGQMTPPVGGALVRAWGDSQDGEPATGQSWQTEPGAPVVAPCGGTVAFAEPFHGYGLLVIIDCGGGYHAVLGGLDQMGVGPGRAVQGGDPVGMMQAAISRSGILSGAPPSPQTSASSGARPSSATPIPSPILYFELRKGGRPVNPAPWLKSSG